MTKSIKSKSSSSLVVFFFFNRQSVPFPHCCNELITQLTQVIHSQIRACKPNPNHCTTKGIRYLMNMRVQFLKSTPGHQETTILLQKWQGKKKVHLGEEVAFQSWVHR